MDFRSCECAAQTDHDVIVKGGALTCVRPSVSWGMFCMRSCDSLSGKRSVSTEFLRGFKLGFANRFKQMVAFYIKSPFGGESQKLVSGRVP